MEKPTMSQRMASFGKFIYNSETKQVLGRGGRSWAEIGIFYVIYYTCLASFFAATLAIFYQTIETDRPKLLGKDSLLKANPGMGFQPMPDIDTTFIYATKTDTEEYVKSIEKVLDEYRDATRGVPCSMSTGLRPGEDVPCQVNFTGLTEECNSDNDFGMKTNEPCVLLKLNRIYGWTPELWTQTEAASAKEIPDDVKAKYTDDRIWVTCMGENAADQDNLDKAEVTYYPDQGFPLGFYPYEKQNGYLSPLIFVKFKNIPKFLAYMIECRALAKNIAVDREEKEGTVTFELLVD